MEERATPYNRECCNREWKKMRNQWERTETTAEKRRPKQTGHAKANMETTRLDSNDMKRKRHQHNTNPRQNIEHALVETREAWASNRKTKKKAQDVTILSEKSTNCKIVFQGCQKEYRAWLLELETTSRLEDICWKSDAQTSCTCSHENDLSAGSLKSWVEKMPEPEN